MKDKNDNASMNATTNLLHLFQHIFALIYSFGVLYYLRAPALLWLVWFFLQFCGFSAFCFALVAAKRRGEFEQTEVKTDEA